MKKTKLMKYVERYGEFPEETPQFEEPKHLTLEERRAKRIEREKKLGIYRDNLNPKKSSLDDELSKKDLKEIDVKPVKPVKPNIKKGNKAKKQDTINILAENKRLDDEFKRLNKTTKQLKPFKDIGTIMTGKSELVNKKGKLSVDTDLNVKKGLEPKVKKALKKSVDIALEKEIKGGNINLDYSSDEEEPKKEEKKIDIQELRNYAKMLSHLLDHIEDPKEPRDKKDYRDAKKLIDNMEKVKKRGRPRKN